jgi:hypothetical protein
VQAPEQEPVHEPAPELVPEAAQPGAPQGDGQLPPVPQLLATSSFLRASARQRAAAARQGVALSWAFG